MYYTMGIALEVKGMYANSYSLANIYSKKKIIVCSYIVSTYRSELATYSYKTYMNMEVF